MVLRVRLALKEAPGLEAIQDHKVQLVQQEEQARKVLPVF
jgi:hypothetical protein